MTDSKASEPRWNSDAMYVLVKAVLECKKRKNPGDSFRLNWNEVVSTIKQIIEAESLSPSFPNNFDDPKRHEDLRKKWNHLHKTYQTFESLRNSESKDTGSKTKSVEYLKEKLVKWKVLDLFEQSLRGESQPIDSINVPSDQQPSLEEALESASFSQLIDEDSDDTELTHQPKRRKYSDSNTFVNELQPEQMASPPKVVQNTLSLSKGSGASTKSKRDALVDLLLSIKENQQKTLQTLEVLSESMRNLTALTSSIADYLLGGHNVTSTSVEAPTIPLPDSNFFNRQIHDSQQTGNTEMEKHT